jgi:hypothetical protein
MGSFSGSGNILNSEGPLERRGALVLPEKTVQTEWAQVGAIRLTKSLTANSAALTKSLYQIV